VDVQLVSETVVSGSGSGGHNGGAVHVAVSSTSHERAHIFLRRDSGQEVEVDIRNPNVGIRKDHRLSAIYAGPKSYDRGHLVALFNHDTGRQAIYHHRIESTVRRTGPGMAFLLLAGLPVSGCYAGGIVGAGANMAAGETTIFALMPGVLFMVGLVLAIVRLRRAKRRIEGIKSAVQVQIGEEIVRLSQQAHPGGLSSA
jgi:hypothetical protein